MSDTLKVMGLLSPRGDEKNQEVRTQGSRAQSNRIPTILQSVQFDYANAEGWMDVLCAREATKTQVHTFGWENLNEEDRETAVMWGIQPHGIHVTDMKLWEKPETVEKAAQAEDYFCAARDRRYRKILAILRISVETSAYVSVILSLVNARTFEKYVVYGDECAVVEILESFIAQKPGRNAKNADTSKQKTPRKPPIPKQPSKKQKKTAQPAISIPAPVIERCIQVVAGTEQNDEAFTRLFTL